MWTSYAQFAAFGILLARTDPSAPPHRGISCLLVDMRSPGITIRPLRQLTGSAEFSETFFDNVVVPRENLIGPENEGWRVATTTLAHERGTAFSFKEQVLHKIYVDELGELLRARGAGADPVLRQRYAARVIEVEIMRLHNCAHHDPPGARRAARRRELDRQALLGRPDPGRSPASRSTRSAPPPSSPGAGRSACCGRAAPRSPAGRTRSSATSSPSGYWDCQRMTETKRLDHGGQRHGDQYRAYGHRASVSLR